jgi:hypothetical protein
MLTIGGELLTSGGELLTSGGELLTLPSSNSKIESMIPDIASSSEKNTKIIETRYCCDYCQFSTTVKKESEKHRKSKQHIRNENKEEDFLEIVNRFICMKCDKTYNKYNSCWKHSKTCPEICENIIFEINSPLCITVPETIVESVKEDACELMMETMITKMMGKMFENNENMIGTMIDKITEKFSHNQSMIQNNNTVMNNNSNNTTNQYTINMFLNDKCKDAMNVGDFVENMKIDFDNLHYNAEHGFQKGLTKMLIDNLNLLSVYNRPIHFTDLKRDIMYIKDANEWTKHENNDKLVETLEWAAKQGIRCFAEWMEENTPAYHNLDGNLGKLYMKIHQTVIRCQVDRTKAFPKVLKEVARATYLSKTEQV